MRPDRHVIYSFIFSLIIFILIPSVSFSNILLMFLSATLFIDLDHYLYYVLRKKDFNFKRAFFWYGDNWKKFNTLSMEDRKKVYGGIYFFHGIEFLTILLILTFIFSKFFLFVFIGFLFHMLLDWYQEIKLKERTDKLFIINDILEFRKLKHIEDF